MTQINFESIGKIDRQPAAAKDWTVMVYLAGDNNLSENMAYSLESLGRLAGSLSEEERARINLLAFFDGSSLTAPTMYLDFSDARQGQGPFRQAVTSDVRSHQTAERSQPPHEDSADALLNFIRWCTTDENGPQRKARNYALILSGHSLGFHGNTFLRNESSGQYFTLTGMRRALEQANELYLKNDTDGRIAILGFDSCVMSMVEIGYEFKDVARTLIASEGSLPNSGWAYAPMVSSFVSALAKDTGKTEARSGAGRKTEIHSAARSFVQSFTGFYKDLTIGGGSIDISAWDLDSVELLVATVDRLGERLNTLLGEPESALFRELKRILLQSHYDSQTYMADQCVDIKDFCERFIEEGRHAGSMKERPAFDRLAEICVEAIEAVDDCVLKCGFSGDAYQFSNGISMFFPWSRVAFALTDSRYRALRFVCGDENNDVARPLGPGKNWYSFLLNYVGNITVRKARKQAKNSAAKPSTCGSIFQTQTAGVQTAPAFTKGGAPLEGNITSCAKDVPPLAKDVPPLAKDVPPLAKGIDESGNYLFHFRRFKNYELGWEISGFADDPADS